MAKTKTQFVCSACGGVQHRWAGRCPDCGQWDTLESFTPTNDTHRGTAEHPSLSSSPQSANPALPLSQIDPNLDATGNASTGRIPTHIGELDRVLGGTAPHTGIVPGSVILIGGDPGIGKSTLLLMAAGRIAQNDQTILYATSEESAQQLRLRADRLNISQPQNPNTKSQTAPPVLKSKIKNQKSEISSLLVLADTNLARIVEQIRLTNPAVVVIDSIQMIYKSDLPAAPGSVSQLRTCAQELVYLAKSTGTAIFLVGHVTKQGTLAGPRLLEHMVDTVLYFEGDRYHQHRIIRAIKNRYGATLEVGLFEMTDAGLAESTDASGILANEHAPRSGSVVCPVLQGSRCLLVEIQALTATGFLGSAKRKTSGIDSNRLAMLIAVLEKRGGLRLADQDIFTSNIGGMKIIEPAADLAIALAITGAHYDRQLDHGTCAIGEIGLGGEIRHVQQMPMRLAEAARLGFTRIIVPKNTKKPPKNCQLIPVENISHAIENLN